LGGQWGRHDLQMLDRFHPIFSVVSLLNHPKIASGYRMNGMMILCGMPKTMSHTP
jgi:hypothetical protein